MVYTVKRQEYLPVFLLSEYFSSSLDTPSKKWKSYITEEGMIAYVIIFSILVIVLRWKQCLRNIKLAKLFT